MSVDVCVVGGGMSGIAIALRSAKLGHRVVLIEATEALGGSIRPVRVGDTTLDDGRTDMLLPAALRDMFRKTGRPLERELDLATVDGARRFWLDTRSSNGPVLELPLLGRGAHHAAVAATFGDRSAQVWTATLDAGGDTWDAVRRVVENEPEPSLRSIGIGRARRLGFPHRFPASVRQLSRLPGGDVLAAAAGYPLVRDGYRLDRAPAALAALPYLEQNLGRWHPAGGARGLLGVLARRLDLRGVDVVTGCPVLDLTGRAGEVTGVRTAEGAQRADIVVTAVGPAALAQLLGHTAPSLARSLRSVTPRPARRVTFARVARELVPDGYENVLLGEPVVTVRSIPPDVSGGSDGDARWLVLESTDAVRDLLGTAAARGLDLRRGVLERHDGRRPASSGGAQLAGWRTLTRLAPVATTTGGRLPTGLLVVGHGSYLPAGLPTELLSAALAAAALPTTPGSAEPNTFA